MNIFPVTFLCFACMERDVSKSEATQVFLTTSSEIEIPPVLNKKSKKIELQLLQSSPIYVVVSLRRSHDQVRGIKMEDSPRSNLYWWCSSRPMDRGNFSFPIWIQSRSKYKWERDKWGLSLAKTMKLIDKKHFLNGSRGQWQSKMTLITCILLTFSSEYSSTIYKITILVEYFYKTKHDSPFRMKRPKRTNLRRIWRSRLMKTDFSYNGREQERWASISKNTILSILL